MKYFKPSFNIIEFSR